MPKTKSRNKRGKPRLSTGAGPGGRRTYSVKELLSRKIPSLTRVTDQAVRGDFWNGWLCRHLPTGLAERVSGVVEREDTLVVFAESAGWSARLRFALHELEPQIRAASPAVSAIRVRVRPRE